MRRIARGPIWDPRSERDRRERGRRRRRERAARAARKVREKLGDGPLGRAVGWIVRTLLEMDPPGPMRDP